MKLLSPVSFPVSRGTPMISPLVAWDHSTSWAVPKAEDFLSGGSGKMNDAKFEVSIAADSDDSYIEGGSDVPLLTFNFYWHYTLAFCLRALICQNVEQ